MDAREAAGVRSQADIDGERERLHNAFCTLDQWLTQHRLPPVDWRVGRRRDATADLDDQQARSFTGLDVEAIVGAYAAALGVEAVCEQTGRGALLTAEGASGTSPGSE